MPSETRKNKSRARVVVEGAGDLALIDAVHEALASLWTLRPEIPDDERTLFALAVGEVVTNMIEHASGGRTPHVRVQIEAEERALTAVMRDDAPHADIRWDAVAMPGPTAESGRGLALALAVLDELVHEEAPAAVGNTWRLRKALPHA